MAEMGDERLWLGVNQDIVALANRLAGQELHVIVPDFFDARTAATPEEAEHQDRTGARVVFGSRAISSGD
ncbi:hypothetical protein [Sulfobacillus harzensis]|uniref:Uncharacterized protein n=1 Tax=Sulfobacillus harzensis TaxID=2729629 RepID=A0A7Y0L7Z7_9FIRM|nr:hypothetical protein [Sulfobacillus harzensis]NMP24895.1 hypothetical protein [Sulfobacillus harzensis]